MMRKVSPAYRLLLIWTALILHGSLFPWHFQAQPMYDPITTLLRNWPFELNRFVVRDTSVNVTIYVPFGLFGWMALDRANRGRVALPILGGLLLSVLVEVLQYFTPTRLASLADVACNTVGTGLGVLVARLFDRRLREIEPRLAAMPGLRPSARTLVLSCWIGYQVVPLFPALSRTRLAIKIAAFVSPPSLWPVDTFLSCAEWCAVAWLLDGLVDRRRHRTWLVALLLLIPARFLLEGRVVSAAELMGGGLALAVWDLWLVQIESRARVVAGLLVGAIVLAGLKPFHFAETATAFLWVPFSGSLMAETEAGLAVLLRKTFDYGAAIWVLRGAGLDLPLGTIILAVLLGAIEAVQVFLPGRTAEITDPLLAIGVAYALALAARAHPTEAMIPSSEVLSGDATRGV